MPTRPSRRRSVLVTGATGLLGVAFFQRLKLEDLEPVALGRSALATEPSIIGNLSEPGSITFERRFDLLFHLAPLWLLPDNLPRIADAGVRRVVAFGSTSVKTKKRSSQEADRVVAAALADAEKRLWALAKELGLALTLLRPTMIYGFGRDRNVSTIADTIQRFSFFPIAGPGRGLRQPVHVLDLVEAGIQCLDNQSTYAKTYNLGGHERMRYRLMVERIFAALGQKPRIVSLPVAVYETLLWAALKARMTHGLSPAAANRMNQDLCFDNGPARQDFGYHPSKFLRDPRRDLPQRRRRRWGT